MSALNDVRLQRRYESIVAAMTKAPDQSFPRALGDEAALEGAYRFLNNERVEWQALLAQIVSGTVDRLTAVASAYAIHDSTMFMLGGEAARGDIGSLDGKGPSFLGHFAIAVSADERAEVLGVLGIEPVFRPDGPRRTKEHWRARHRNPEKESLRWLRMVDVVGSVVQRRDQVIHLMDSEGDSFELLSHLIAAGDRFVIRGTANRVLSTDEKMTDALAKVDAVVCRPVPISARTKVACRGRKDSHTSREGRVAKLQIRAATMSIRRPDRMPHLPQTIALNLVHVFEVECPAGVEPVDWRLYTTEPIETPAEALAVVDHYRRRWVVEEFFKALKTGCSYEKRQLETRRALLNALALLSPIAATLVGLRSESRNDIGPTTTLTAKQIAVLRAVSRRPLPANPTGRQVMLAVAALGGHIKNNGDPGWLVLGRGLTDLLAYELGWDARERSDQS